MRVVTMLPAELLANLVETVGDLHCVHPAADPIELHRLLSCVDASLLIIDPTVRDGLFAKEIESAVSYFRSLPTVIYTTVSPRAIGLVLRLAPLGVRHLVLYGIDDEPRLFLELIERVPAYPIVDLMLRELSESMSLLPVGVARAVELLFQSPSRARTSADLAELAGTTRRSLYRHMSQAGLQPRQLIDCARLLRAYALIRTPGSRLKEISTKLGFADPQTLRDLMREVCGQSMDSIQKTVAPALFIRLLMNYLLHSDAETAALVEST